MILVTGGTGLVGGHLLFELSQKQTAIRAIYRSLNSLEITKEIFKLKGDNDLSLFQKIEWFESDLNDIPTLETAFQAITHVYHCAAMVSFNPKDEFLLRKVNIEGTANIVNLCLDNKIHKLCYVSSIATLSPKPEQEFINETNEWNPELAHSDYSITKFGAEMEVWRATQEGLDVVIVNPGVIFGSGNWSANTGKLIQNIYKGMPFYTDGATGVVAVEDVVKYMMILMDSEIKNERFVLVGSNITYQKLFSLIADNFNKKAPSIKVPKLILTSVLYVGELIRILTFSKISLINKYSIKAANNVKKYNGQLVTEKLAIPYTPFSQSINTICKDYLQSL